MRWRNLFVSVGASVTAALIALPICVVAALPLENGCDPNTTSSYCDYTFPLGVVFWVLPVAPTILFLLTPWLYLRLERRTHTRARASGSRTA